MNYNNMETCYDYCVRNRNQSTLCGCPYPQFFPDQPSENDPCYRTYSTVLIIFLLPLLACYGIMGNVFNLIIYCQKVMRCSMNCYLAMLAAGDLILALTSVFMFTFEVMGNTNDFVRRLYLSYIKYVFPVGMVAQTCTVYFTVAAGLDCLITVVCRKLIKIFCTVKRALVVGVCVICFAVLYNASRWLEISIIRCFDSEKNVTFAEVCESNLRQNPTYKQVYHLHMSTLMMAIGPLIVLLIVNLLVIKSVHRRRNWKALAVSTRTTVISMHSDINVEEIAECSADIASLICVVCLFIFCNALSLIINFIENFADMGQSMSYLVDISNFLVVLNSSVNFTIYMICGDNFRHCFTNLFFCPSFIKPKKLERRNGSNNKNANKPMNKSSA